MADLTENKDGIGLTLPEGVIESTWGRLEPLITAERVRLEHLFGIPLVSAIKDPITNRAQVMTDELITSFVQRAVSMVENDLSIEVMPSAFQERLPFNRADYQSFGYTKSKHKPINSIQSFKVVPSNGEPVFSVPLDWIDIGGLHYGQINLIPLTLAITKSGTTFPVATAGGAVVLALLGYQPWIAFWWELQGISGFDKDGKVPRIVNELIGTITAMEILSALAATYARSTSQSLGIDSLSQSTSTPGPQLFKVRLEELADKRQRITNKVKTMLGNKIFTSDL